MTVTSNRVRWTGLSGSLRWSYHQAAELGNWTLHVDADGATLTATVVRHDAFKVAQQPLAFVVSRPQGQFWRWPVKSLQIAAQTVTATLGPQE